MAQRLASENNLTRNASAAWGGKKKINMSNVVLLTTQKKAVVFVLQPPPQLKGWSLAAHLLDGQKSGELPLQALGAKVLAHLSDLDEDEEPGV